MYYYDQLATPIGLLTLVEHQQAIAAISLNPPQQQSQWQAKKTPLLQQAAAQLQQYFAGTRTHFDLPLLPQGTAFQQKVWTALLDIAYGQTKSYKDIAIAIGNVNACRAVGGANNKNPIIIVIPCHRVIGSNGTMVGYAGGIATKETLLTLEANYHDL